MHGLWVKRLSDSNLVVRGNWLFPCARAVGKGNYRRRFHKLTRLRSEPVVCAWGAAPFSQSGLWHVLVHLTHFELIVNS